MWKDSSRNIVVIFQPNILGIVGFYVRHSANIWDMLEKSPHQASLVRGFEYRKEKTFAWLTYFQQGF